MIINHMYCKPANARAIIRYQLVVAAINKLHKGEWTQERFEKFIRG